MLAQQLCFATIFSSFYIQDNNTFDDDYLPSSLVDIVFEPCIICNGSGTYDIVKSVDEEVESWTDVCSEKIDAMTDLYRDEFVSIGECKELEERCAVCHNSTFLVRNKK